MELPQIKSRVLSVRVNKNSKNQATSQSISHIDKSEMSVKLYRLRGNHDLELMQKYNALMKKYMEGLTGQRIIRSTKKEIWEKKRLRSLGTPSQLSTNFSNKYRIVHTPLQI